MIADIRNPIENPRSRGKARPAVLVRASGSSWEVIGLTSKRTYATGSPRVAVPFPGRVGLYGPGYIWSPNLARISAIDVDHHVGWVDRDLAMAIIRLANLDEAAATDLLNGARWCEPRSIRPGDGGVR